MVGVWLDHGLIINHEPIQTQCAVCRQIKKGSAVVRGERGQMRGKRGVEGGGKELPEISVRREGGLNSVMNG